MKNYFKILKTLKKQKRKKKKMKKKKLSHKNWKKSWEISPKRQVPSQAISFMWLNLHHIDYSSISDPCIVILTHFCIYFATFQNSSIILRFGIVVILLSFRTMRLYYWYTEHVWIIPSSIAIVIVFYIFVFVTKCISLLRLYVSWLIPVHVITNYELISML